MSEKFMIEFFSYRTMLELGLKLEKNYDDIRVLWRLRGMIEEDLKEKLPTFKELVKKIKRYPFLWDKRIIIFKEEFLIKCYPKLFEEEYERQFNKGSDVAYKEAIKFLEKKATEDIKNSQMWDSGLWSI